MLNEKSAWSGLNNAINMVANLALMEEGQLTIHV